MDYMSNKALVIAVSLLVTMGIASAVLYTINQVMGIYKDVYETDTLIQSNFDEFDAYDGAVKTELDLLNVAKKYKDSDTVYVTYKNQDEVTASNISAIKNNRINNPDVIKNIDNATSSLEVNKGEQGEISVNTSEASKKYNTYVKKFDNIVVIGFVAI